MEELQLVDVTGFELERALELLRSETDGEITVKLTKAPRSSREEYDSKSRVVRQRVLPNSCYELVVCNMDHS